MIGENELQEIATLTNLSVNDIRSYLPSILNTIRNYTHRTFITTVSVSGNIVISDGKILLSDDDLSKFTADMQIELKGSLNNTKIYTIKSIGLGEIETYEHLYDEEYTGYIIRLSFNIDLNAVADMISYKNINSNPAIQSENIDGYSYTLNNSSNQVIQGYPMSILCSFDELRCLPGNEEREYKKFGYV